MKRVIAIVLVFVLVFQLSSFGTTYTVKYEGIASKLQILGVFKGTTEGFELDRAATRVEAGVMLVRLLGAEQEALDSHYEHPFIDVPEWASDYIGYLYHEKLTNGISSDSFGALDNVSGVSYMTFVLRALGYNDAEGDFIWNQSFEFALKEKLIGNDDFNELSSNLFYRDHVAKLSYLALNMKLNNSNQLLVDKLIDLNAIDPKMAVFTGVMDWGGRIFDYTESIVVVVDNETRLNPAPIDSDEGTSIQLYDSDMKAYLGTAINANSMPNFSIKSQNGSNFIFLDFYAVSTIEAIKEDGSALSYLGTSYKVDRNDLVYLDDTVEMLDGDMPFSLVLYMLSALELNTNTIGTTATPNPSDFLELKQVWSYYMMVMDENGEVILLQFYLETVTDSADL